MQTDAKDVLSAQLTIQVNFLGALREIRKYGFQLTYMGSAGERSRWTRQMIESMFGKENADIVEKELNEYFDMMQRWNAVANQ